MEKNKDMNEEELKAQQEETLDNVATSQPDEGDKAEEQPAKEMSVEDKLAAAETKVAECKRKSKPCIFCGIIIYKKNKQYIHKNRNKE